MRFYAEDLFCWHVHQTSAQPGSMSAVCCVPAAFAVTRFYTAANAKVVCTYG